MRIVLLGAPGSGKGTQSQRLVQRFSIPQISTGDLLRSAVARGSALGLAAKGAMQAGKLVSDDIVLGMIRERLSDADVANGFILDGFPRNIVQAEALDAMLRELGKPLSAVVQLDVPYAELTRRIAGRRSCQSCGRVFNIYSMPLGAPLVCPTCPGNPALFQRPDDNEATVVERLKVYEAQTRPLLKYYARQGLLQSIEATGDVDAITSLLVHVLTVPALQQLLQRAAAPKRKTSAKKRKAPAKKRKTVVRRKKPAARRVAKPKRSTKRNQVVKKRVAKRKRPARKK
jgi:adenylate kinase